MNGAENRMKKISRQLMAKKEHNRNEAEKILFKTDMIDSIKSESIGNYTEDDKTLQYTFWFDNCWLKFYTIYKVVFLLILLCTDIFNYTMSDDIANSIGDNKRQHRNHGRTLYNNVICLFCFMCL